MAEILDSGMRREFDTGAVRDMAEGKGRCDLMPLDVVAQIMNDSIITEIESYRQTGSVIFLYNAIRYFIAVRYESIAEAMLELSIHFEEGAKKYGEYNWQKGLPPSSFIDSGVRHYFKWLRGDEDERHDRAFMWNIVCLIWTEKYKPGVTYTLDEVKSELGLKADCTENELEDKEKAAGSEKVHRKTYLEDFLEKYPNAPVVPDGLPTACRAPIYGGHCQRDPSIHCEDCWRELMPEEGCT